LKTLLIFYSHFAPAFKAGGPVQSLVNLVELLKDRYRIYVFCGAYELGARDIMPGIKADQWNSYKENVWVFYTAGNRVRAIRFVLKECNPDVVYINGLFLPLYNWLPLWLSKKKSRKVIVAPRGMLQHGALAIRQTKKKWFLRAFKLVRLSDSIFWHATDEQERTDIENIFGPGTLVTLAANIPKKPISAINSRTKRTGELRLIYLSLITEKKNLLIALEALKSINQVIQFDIYGPIQNIPYWQKCVRMMQGQVHSIQYKGVVNPEDVQVLLADYHALILPTKGENFGHAIYEALSVGTPVIVSPFTPWGILQDRQAGITVSPEASQLANAITTLQQYDANQYMILSSNAHKLATEYYTSHDYIKEYTALFE